MILPSYWYKSIQWLATLWGGNLQFKTPLLFARIYNAITIGGLTGVVLANAG